MEFKRLKALYEAGSNVHYEDKLCEIISINELKKQHRFRKQALCFQRFVK